MAPGKKSTLLGLHGHTIGAHKVKMHASEQASTWNGLISSSDMVCMKPCMSGIFFGMHI